MNKNIFLLFLWMLLYCLRYELLKYKPSSVHLPEILRLHNGCFSWLYTLPAWQTPKVQAL